MSTPTVEVVIPGDLVPRRVRTVAYFVALIVGAAATLNGGVWLALGTAGVVGPVGAALGAALGGLVASAVATICGGLGVVYRPTQYPPALAEVATGPAGSAP